MRVVLASWNVHGWVGSDGLRDAARSFEVIRALDADVVALQEAEGSDWKPLAEAAGFRTIMGLMGSSPFGNALLVRVPVVSVRRIDLSVSGREQRGALDAIVSLEDGPFRFVAAHLGLRVGERRRQATRLARHILEQQQDTALPIALMGDLNDWTPWGSQLRPLTRVLGPFSRIPTFPSRRPLFPLDRAAWRAPELAARLAPIRTPDVRIASDHLPLRLELANRARTTRGSSSSR